MINELQKPGEKPRRSGEYIERGEYGQAVPNARIVTIEVGDTPLPPTQRPNWLWQWYRPISRR